MCFLGQNGRIKSILNAELDELKKPSKTGLYKIPKMNICIQIPFSSLIVRSCLLWRSPCCVTDLYYDYILVITLKKRQTVYEWFYSMVMILSYLIEIDVRETKGKGLSSTISHISKNDRLFYSQRLKRIAIDANLKRIVIDANLMIKQ